MKKEAALEEEFESPSMENDWTTEQTSSCQNQKKLFFLSWEISGHNKRYREQIS